jgi:hypothetical protein
MRFAHVLPSSGRRRYAVASPQVPSPSESPRQAKAENLLCVQSEPGETTAERGSRMRSAHFLLDALRGEFRHQAIPAKPDRLVFETRSMDDTGRRVPILPTRESAF